MDKLKYLFFIVGLIISQACYSSSKIIYVDSYRLNFSDTKAIYEAFKDGREFNGDVTIKFGKGSYEIDPSELIGHNLRSDIFLYELFGNLKIEGNSNTILNLKIGWPEVVKSKISNFIFFGSRKNIENFELKDISIDFNGGINSPRTISGSLNNAFIYIKYGRNIHVSNIQVFNNPGRQSIFLGGATKDGKYTLSNVIIEYSLFKNNTDHFSSNNQNDHSTIYVAAKNAAIRNNHLISGDHVSKVSTAIEGHLINSKVINNNIERYDTGINVVGTVGNQINSVYKNNKFLNVNKAFVFWGKKGRTLRDILISDNVIQQSSTSASMLSMGKTLQTYITNLRIQNNMFSATQATGMMSDKIVGNCIDLGYVKNAVIKNNTFDGINGRAITLSAPNIDIDSLIIEGNNFVKTNLARNPKYNHIIGLKGVGKIKYLQISNNDYHNQSKVYSIGKRLRVFSKEIE